jgi:hypothetical protein
MMGVRVDGYWRMGAAKGKLNTIVGVQRRGWRSKGHRLGWLLEQVSPASRRALLAISLVVSDLFEPWKSPGIFIAFLVRAPMSDSIVLPFSPHCPPCAPGFTTPLSRGFVVFSGSNYLPSLLKIPPTPVNSTAPLSLSFRPTSTRIEAQYCFP